jgi:hypothetical protein
MDPQAPATRLQQPLALPAAGRGDPQMRPRLALLLAPQQGLVRPERVRLPPLLLLLLLSGCQRDPRLLLLLRLRAEAAPGEWAAATRRPAS